MNIPEGWKLVPEKETHEMRGAFREAEKSALLSGHDHIEAFFCGYRAMLAVAPTPPAQNNEDAVRKLMEQAQVFASAWSLIGGMFDSGNALQDAEEAKAELEEMLRQVLTTPPAQDEPVAWMHTSRENSSEGHDEPSYFDYTYIHQNKELADKGSGHIPLYTRPQSDKLRLAAEEAIAWFENPVAAQKSSVELANNLRAALEGK